MWSSSKEALGVLRGMMGDEMREEELDELLRHQVIRQELYRRTLIVSFPFTPEMLPSSKQQ